MRKIMSCLPAACSGGILGLHGFNVLFWPLASWGIYDSAITVLLVAVSFLASLYCENTRPEN